MDEIGDISPKMQVKMLRTLQEREIMPVGSTEAEPVDVRIISATNKNLEEMVSDGKFREDLYYRLNVFPLFIPPLRQRKNDMKEIVLYLLNKYDSFYDRSVTEITDEAVNLLKEEEWPGNVRELENVVSRALINLDMQAKTLNSDDILEALGSKKILKKASENPKGEHPIEMDSLPRTLNAAMKETEKILIENSLRRWQGDKNKAAAELDVPLRTFYYKCKTLGIK